MRKNRLILFNYIYKTVILLTSSILISTVVWKTPCIFGLRPMFVVSESMEPAIQKYQFILGVVSDGSDFEKGEIAAYEAGNKLVVHRIVEINEDGTYTFQGDNNKYPLLTEKNVQKEQIKYRIVWY